MGMTMETAEVVRWVRAENDYVNKGEILLELQIDKAVLELESPGSGYLRIVAREGEELPVGELLATLHDAAA